MAHKLVRMWALNVLILFQSYETLKCRVNIEKWTQINALQIIRRQSGFVFFFVVVPFQLWFFFFYFLLYRLSSLCAHVYAAHYFIIPVGEWHSTNSCCCCFRMRSYCVFVFFLFLFVKWCFTDVVLDWHWKRIRIAQMTMVSAHNELYSSNCSAIVVNKYILFSHNTKKHHINLDGITMRACYYVWSIETTIERERERKRAYIFRLPFDDCGSL